ncbi:hypothetical protein AAFF_G00432200 [Aldrovandia affinis]|uniref:Uncharacterized protein n=1 Tax=Aldrovandia affinis TaxID=143900 RepID=A0AAD7VXQ1_9TELE|nr:hypothetical protein AAFF_G00432200 [Aldrovandia affinis]
MAHRSDETLKACLSDKCLCITVGPGHEAIAYERDGAAVAVKELMPTICSSQIVFHVYCPNLFSDRVLAIHGEHLGYLLTAQNAKAMDSVVDSGKSTGETLGSVMWRSLVATLGADVVSAAPYVTDIKFVCDNADDYDTEVEAWHLLRGCDKVTAAVVSYFLDLFDTSKLEGVTDCAEEPPHLIFAGLCQIIAVALMNTVSDHCKAKLLSVAAATFLELNHCSLDVAAASMRPIFIPLQGEGDEASVRYTLFRGFMLQGKGSSISWDSFGMMTHNITLMVEHGQCAFWAVAPQYGDRLAIIKEYRHIAMQPLGGNDQECGYTIANKLLCDHVVCYMQHVTFGALANMLPCGHSRQFTARCFNVVNNNIYKVEAALLAQSKKLHVAMGTCAGDDLLSCVGTGFGVNKCSNSNTYGKLNAHHSKQQTPGFGRYVMVVMAMATKAHNLPLTLRAIAGSFGDASHFAASLRTEHRPQLMALKHVNTFNMLTRNHRFNTGFTEAGDVVGSQDMVNTMQNSTTELTVKAKYVLTTTNGAMPMCHVSLATTLRQASMLCMGYLAWEMGRVVYSGSVKRPEVSLSTMVNVFKGKLPAGIVQDEPYNMFGARGWGDLIKMTGKMFSNAYSPYGRIDLEKQTWLDHNNITLPENLRQSLKGIGWFKNTSRAGGKQCAGVVHRLLFGSKQGTLAPLLTSVQASCFTGNNSELTYAGLKLNNSNYQYIVTLLNNRCINLNAMVQDPVQRTFNELREEDTTIMLHKVRKPGPSE